MSKPDDVTQQDWDASEAVGAAVYGRHERGWVCWPLVDAEALRPAIARAIAIARDEGRAEAQCCACGKTGLSTVEDDGGTECQLDDGRWTCSQDCYDRALGWDGEPVAWMHPTAGWVHQDKQQIAMHCSTDGPKPVPLVIAGRAALASLPTAGDGKGGVE